MLLLITILSLLAASILAEQYCLRHTAMLDVAKVKAVYAAESGIAMELSGIETQENLLTALRGDQESFSFDDGSVALVDLRGWGAYLIARSEGRCHGMRSIRMALVADHPSPVFKNALLFANPNEQLVFTGQASITGNIIVGPAGAAVGNLTAYGSPIAVPVNGSIERSQDAQIPAWQLSHFMNEISYYRKLLSEVDDDAFDSNAVRYSSNEMVNLGRGSIMENTEFIFIDGDVSISDSLTRREIPLYIAVRGRVCIKNDSRLRGLVGVISTEATLIESKARIDRSIIFSQRSIQLESNGAVSGQLIAPSVLLDPGSQASYPSLILSVPSSVTDKQTITLLDNSKVEGFVALLSASDDPEQQHIINLTPAATVVGAIYTNAQITLDGTVIGTVLTKDFRFYVAPTTYLGWLRSGRIDRTTLPSGFFVPPGFADELKLDVLEWL